jgi:hypothetical protein
VKNLISLHLHGLKIRYDDDDDDDDDDDNNNNNNTHVE